MGSTAIKNRPDHSDPQARELLAERWGYRNRSLPEKHRRRRELDRVFREISNARGGRR